MSILRASLVVQRVKNLPTMQEMQVQSLGLEDPLEKEMATHSNILAWKIPLMEKPGRLQSMGVTNSRTRLSNFTFTSGNISCKDGHDKRKSKDLTEHKRLRNGGKNTQKN